MRKWLRGQQTFWEGRWDKMIRCHNFREQLINYSSGREYCSLWETREETDGQEK